MSRKLVLLMTLIVLMGMLRVVLKVQRAKASGTIYVRADGSVEPEGAPISSVDNVTYTLTGNITSDADGIVVGRSNIIIDGNGYTLRGSGLGKGFDLSGINNVTIKNTDISAREHGRDLNFNYGVYLNLSSFNTISGNSITNNYFSGIYLEESPNNTISGNNVTNNYHGIYLEYSSNNTICGNNVTNSEFFLPFHPAPTKTHGIVLAFSSGNFLRNNVMADSDFNFGVLGGVLSDFVNDVDVSNSVDGKPVNYLVSRRDVEVPLDAGYVALVNCTNIGIENLTLTKNMQGILLAYTNCTTIVGNNITNNWNGILLWYSSSYNNVFGNNVAANNGVGISFVMCSNNTASGNNITDTDNFGIYLQESSGNTISGNYLTNNECCIHLQCSSNNTFYHNDFINNTIQVSIVRSYNNTWDNGYPSGGNYWSDYEERYPNATEIEDSCIWDTPYVIDENNRDNYPIVPEFPSFLILPLFIVATILTVIVYRKNTLCSFIMNGRTECT